MAWNNCISSSAAASATTYAVQLGPQELDDRLHDTFLIVVNAVRRGDLREPERLMGFVRTVVRRQVAAYIEQAVHQRRDLTDFDFGFTVADSKQNPEQEAIVGQRAELMKNTLSVLSEKDREILTRFYLKEQPQEQICREMDLSETQFRLLKSRAKAKFGEIGRKSLAAGRVLSVQAKVCSAISEQIPKTTKAELEKAAALDNQWTAPAAVHRGRDRGGGRMVV